MNSPEIDLDEESFQDADPDDMWQMLDFQERVVLKSIDDGMAHRYVNEDDELTPLGEGIVWWLVTVYPEAHYPAMLCYLGAKVEEVLEQIPPDSKEDSREFHANLIRVLSEAKDRVEASAASDVDDDAENDESDEEPDD